MTEDELLRRFTPAQLRALATRALAECCASCRGLLRVQLEDEEFRERR